MELSATSTLGSNSPVIDQLAGIIGKLDARIGAEFTALHAKIDALRNEMEELRTTVAKQSALIKALTAATPPDAGFTADDRKMLRSGLAGVRKLLRDGSNAKPDRRTPKQRECIDAAVHLYILRHDIEKNSGAKFSTACEVFWNCAKEHFKNKRQYQNCVRYDYNNYYSLEAEKGKIRSRGTEVPWSP